MVRIIMIFAALLGTIELCSSQELRVALVQSTFAWGDVDRNLVNFEDKIKSIDSCEMIILPELFTSGCDMQKRDKELKIAIKESVASKYNQVIETMQKWAEVSNSVIVGSTIYQESDRFYNRLLAVYPNGRYEYYDKHNCFKMGEFTPGNQHLVINVNGHKFATYICYDLKFPEWSRNNGRYDSAIYIANWPESRAEDWRQILSERAKENNAHVIGVNCVGTDPANITYMGCSSLYAPSGELLSQCETNEEQVLIVKY